MAKRYYEDFERGDSARSPMGRTISEADVYTQAGLAGSYNPIHTDTEYMADSEFGERLVQNTLLITVASGLNRRLPWDPELIAVYGREDIRFVNPVFIGDTVRLESEVVDKREHGEDRGVVSFEETLRKQDDSVAMSGTTLRLLARAT
jgi:3-hydroxybutyryl-CoA dehydratase